MANHVVHVLGSGTDLLLSCDIGTVAVDGVVVFPPAVVVDPPPVVVPPPVITPPPATPSSDMLHPTSAAEFAAMTQAALNAGRFAIFAPGIVLDVPDAIVFNTRNTGGAPHGIIGNGITLNYRGPGGKNMLTFQGHPADGVCTGLMLSNMFMYGNGYDHDCADACLKLYAPNGDPGAIYKFVLRDIYTSYANRGIVLEGAVFEGYCENIHAENHLSHGMETLHTNINGARGIISNINIVHPNLSRNYGAGLKCTYSTNITMGSFVLNALGGVIAEEGIRYAVGNNGENTGESFFVIPSNGYGTFLQGNEVSSDASTVARRFEGGQWVTKGKPCLYLLNGAAAITQQANHCSYYGSVNPSPMRVVK